MDGDPLLYACLIILIGYAAGRAMRSLERYLQDRREARR